MNLHLVLTIRLHDQRYHGASEWPPAPARVFQALVAGAASGGQLPFDCVAALQWLERLPPPVIVAPTCKRGSRVELFVPNNDLDSVAGDPRNISEIRTKKTIEPWLIEGDPVFRYVWSVSENREHARALIDVASRLYQLGRGVDMAWARAEVVEDTSIEAIFEATPGWVFRPTEGDSELQLSCPTAGTLESLVARHAGMRKRLQVEGRGKSARTLFTQPPKALFSPGAYSSHVPHRVYDLRCSTRDTVFFPWRLKEVSLLVERVRDGVAERLRQAFPEQRELIEQCVVGRNQTANRNTHKARRIRIVPLPSIGHEHADYAIRRILVEVPAECPLPAGDIFWAFSGFEPLNPDTSEFGPFMLTESTASDTMLSHFVSERGANTWRSVTSLALPESAQRRRIEPSRRNDEAKGAQELLSEEAKAIAAINDALRHADVTARAVSIHVQRTPFHEHGENAEAFADGTRFSKHQLWHVEVTLNRPVKGPLVLGNGRFVGLGVMAPDQRTPGIFAFNVVDGLAKHAAPEEIARALRRALMSRVQDILGPRVRLPQFFSGHADGSARPSTEPHLHFFFDPVSRSLNIVAPHAACHRPATSKEREYLDLLQTALAEFQELRAGKSGSLALTPRNLVEQLSDSLFHTSTTWQSVTPYLVARHARKMTASEAIIFDVRNECLRRRLPMPRSIHVTNVAGAPGKGLMGSVGIEFPQAVMGPVLLGRTRHLGGGVFRAAPVTTAST